METIIDAGFRAKSMTPENGDEGLCGWVCTYTPVEIMTAFGLHPLRIRGGDCPISQAEGLMHANLCPWIKHMLASALDGEFDAVRCLVFANSCDGIRRLFEVFQDRFPDREHIFIDLPKRGSDADVDYFDFQLRSLVRRLEQLLGRRIEPGALARAIEEWNQARRHLASVIRLRRRAANPLRASTFIQACQAFTSLKPADFTDICGCFLADPESFGPVFHAAAAPRLLLMGNLIDNGQIMTIFEAAGAVITADDLCSGERLAELEPDPAAADPLSELARAYMGKPPCPRMIRMDAALERAISRARESGADGVIVHTLKFCDNQHYEVPALARGLEAAGLPALFIEGDYSTRMLGPMLTRIEAFVEMVGGRSGGGGR